MENNKDTDLDKNYIKFKLKEILNKVHSNDNKKQIKEKHDRFSMACPICGDSGVDSHLKRGHLFFNNLYYKCYNENCRSTFTGLCKMFEIDIDLKKKIQFIAYIDNNINNIKNDDDLFILSNIEKIIPLQDLQDLFDSGNGPLNGFKPIQKGSKVYNYLKYERKLPETIYHNFYEGVKYNGKLFEPYIVFINKLNDKIIGIQERNLKSGINRKFKILSFKELYDNIYDDELDEIEAISYNKISYLYNILNINFDKTITIFEGFLDSLFIPNSIGAVGINTNFDFLLNNDLDIRFLFDNDKTGRKKTKKFLNDKKTVFILDKLKNDLSKKAKDPYIFKQLFDTNIKDLNDLYKHLEEIDLQISYKELNTYFSNNIYDNMYISLNNKISNKINKDKIYTNNELQNKLKKLWNQTQQYNNQNQE